MEFEWDERKSRDCLARRGFDFDFAIRVFGDGRQLIRQDTRYDYGEDRFQLLGSIEGRVFAVIYTVRGSILRIISARKASRREVREYEHYTHLH